MPKANITIFVIIALFFVAGAYFYPQLPERMASHWNAAGEVNGYMPKFWGLFLLPIMALLTTLLFMWLPKIDPLKENIRSFRKYFDIFIICFLVFLFYIYTLTLAWNLGWVVDITYALVPPFAIGSYLLGRFLPKTKRNWFIGIRTPWTLSSDEVWDRTHALAGKLFKASSIITVLGIFFGQYSIYFAIFPMVGVSLFAVIYSYFEHKRLKTI